MDVFQISGMAGTGINAAAYLPQITHLAREHCSAGVSTKAWSLWLLVSALIVSHAFHVFDLVFVTLQTVNIVAIVLILVLARRYRAMACPLHRVPQDVEATTV